MKFLIQTEEETGIPITDMGLAILRGEQFREWFHNELPDVTMIEEHMALTPEQRTMVCDNLAVPIGTVQWTQEAVGVTIKPLNIPRQYWSKPYFVSRPCKGNLCHSQLEKELVNGPLFVKSATQCKAWAPVIAKNVADVPADKLYFATAPTNFRAEWRAFIYRNKVMDVRRYAGDWWMDKAISREWIEAVCSEGDFSAHTIDFGLNDAGALDLIEVHPFIACGLYGFEDYDVIRKMALLAWHGFLAAQTMKYGWQPLPQKLRSMSDD
ncbi:MAG: ATP-grasp domain-containing protein [Ruthenibacterium sp.]